MKRINAGVYGINSSYYRNAFNARRFDSYKVCDIFRFSWPSEPGQSRYITRYAFNHA